MPIYFLAVAAALAGCSSGATGNITANSCTGSFIASANFGANLISAAETSCTLGDGTAATCCKMSFGSNPVFADGPVCPSIKTGLGGMTIFDGWTATTGHSSGLYALDDIFFDDLVSEGYNILTGNLVNLNDPGSGTVTAPNTSYCLEATEDDSLILTFQVPLEPSLASADDAIGSAELFAVSLDGVPMNGAPPSATDGHGGEVFLPALDYCGGHLDDAGYYHWHFIPQSINDVLATRLTALGGTSAAYSCTSVTQNDEAFVGYALDGFPLYGPQDEGGVTPTDLDSCNGHTAATAEYPDGIYHYHAVTGTVPNIIPCLKGKVVQDADKFNVE